PKRESPRLHRVLHVQRVLPGSDDNTGFIGPIPTDGSGTLSNASCTVSNPTASISGNLLTLTLPLTFATAFDGDRNVWTYASDASGVNTGWTLEETAGIGAASSPPTVDGVNPTGGIGSPRVFSFQYSSSGGAMN